MQEGNGSVAVLIPLGVRLQLYARNSYTAFLLVQQAHVLVANLLVLLDSLVASLLATFVSSEYIDIEEWEAPSCMNIGSVI